MDRLSFSAQRKRIARAILFLCVSRKDSATIYTIPPNLPLIREALLGVENEILHEAIPNTPFRWLGV